MAVTRALSIQVITMIFDRMVNRTVSESQYKFQPESNTMDTISAIRILMEAYRGKNRALHVAFLDLQKAFDCMPRQCIWWSLRSKGIPET